MTERKNRKSEGGRLRRSEVMTMRFDPRTRYMMELASRVQRRTVSSFIDWAVTEALKGVDLGTRRVSVEAFAQWTRRATADRVLLVGDAADFYDPFTGEGIYAALLGAELVAKHASRALEADKLRAADLRGYDVARRRTFGGKWIVERLISTVIAHPALLNRVARRLAVKPAMADVLVGVAGNVVPTSQVLSPSFVWQLIH